MKKFKMRGVTVKYDEVLAEKEDVVMWIEEMMMNYHDVVYRGVVVDASKDTDDGSFTIDGKRYQYVGGRLYEGDK